MKGNYLENKLNRNRFMKLHNTVDKFMTGSLLRLSCGSLELLPQRALCGVVRTYIN